MADETPRDENMIAALKRERAGYVARGETDRVAEVDKQLKEYGYTGQQDGVTDTSGTPKDRQSTASRQRYATGGKVTQSGSESGTGKPDSGTGKSGSAGK